MVSLRLCMVVLLLLVVAGFLVSSSYTITASKLPSDFPHVSFLPLFRLC